LLHLSQALSYYVYSLQLETDSAILIEKAKSALMNYGHQVSDCVWEWDFLYLAKVLYFSMRQLGG